MIDPVLILGGSGAMGASTAKLLRDAHPSLPIAIGARNQERAAAVAQAIGTAAPAPIDLSRRDLGLPANQAYSVVLVALKDASYNSIRFAQDRGIGVILLSEAVFEFAPIAALYAARPDSAPIMILSHAHGGIPSLVAAALAATNDDVRAIRIGMIFDPNDTLPPGAQLDMGEVARVGPPPLALRGGQWTWLRGINATDFTLRSAAGEILPAEAYGLPDLLSLARIAPDADITAISAEGRTTRNAEGRPGHEVVVEIDMGTAHTDRRTRRWRFIDPEGNVMLGSRGFMLATETLAGLGGKKPTAGLYFPESLIAPDEAVRRLADWGIDVREESS